MPKRKCATKSKKRIEHSRRYIISLDVGVHNFAYCIMDTKLKEPKLITVENKKICNFKGTKDYVQMCETAFDFFTESLTRDHWDQTDFIIERQMKSGIMRIFAVALEVAWFHKTGHRAIVLSPITVKRHFGTSTGNYAKNKKAAVNQMAHLCVQYPTLRKKWVNICAGSDKIDDLADALIQAFYYHEIHNHD